MLNLLEDNEYDYVAVTFDSPKPSFRKDLSSTYKSNRAPLEDDLRVQFPIAKSMTEASGLPVLVVDTFEADDIIATLTKKAKDEGHKVTVVTTDKDLFQLIGDDVEIYDPVKKKIIDEAAVIEKFGVTPDRLADLLALSGDKADNSMIFRFFLTHS
jgi:DNA polymerase-1